MRNEGGGERPRLRRKLWLHKDVFRKNQRRKTGGGHSEGKDAPHENADGEPGQSPSENKVSFTRPGDLRT